ncbi:MAG: hypothetical protein SGI96_07540 [Bacteroidota bacterium]|nr:hypothetical protein [Bacteroidota bacterium]
MRNRPFILRCTAFFLLLVFSQKAGAGFFLHNLFHSNIAANKNSSQQHEENKGASYSCTCIDNLLMPFTEAEVPAYSLPLVSFTTPLTFFKEDILFNSSVLSFLRGPPPAIA